MTAGLPGTGLGGVFYLLSALWMPVHSVIRRGRAGERAPGRLIVRQVATAATMIGVLFLTGYALGLLFHFVGAGAAQPGAATATAVAAGPPEILRTALLLLTVGALALLLLIVELAGAVLRRRSRRIPVVPEFDAATEREQYAA
jgi:hypothetical protein